jgi:hypothetical protein
VRTPDGVEHQTRADSIPQPRSLPFEPCPSPFRPYPLSIARILLVAAWLGAPLAFGAVEPWDWVTLGLFASTALFLWALGSVRRGRVDWIWSPLHIPLALFFLLGAAQYAARLTLDTSETRQGLVLLATDLVFFSSLYSFSAALAVRLCSPSAWRS